MKKFIFTAILLAGFSFTSNAQCGSQATYIDNGCSSGCYTVAIPLTGILSVDSANLTATGGTMRRKPTLSEIMMVLSDC